MASFALPPTGQLGNRVTPGQLDILRRLQAQQPTQLPGYNLPKVVDPYGPGARVTRPSLPTGNAPFDQNNGGFGPVNALGGSGSGLNFDINQILGQLGSMGLGGLPGMSQLGNIYGGAGGQQGGLGGGSIGGQQQQPARSYGPQLGPTPGTPAYGQRPVTVRGDPTFGQPDQTYTQQYQAGWSPGANTQRTTLGMGGGGGAPLYNPTPAGYGQQNMAAAAGAPRGLSTMSTARQQAMQNPAMASFLQNTGMGAAAGGSPNVQAINGRPQMMDGRGQQLAAMAAGRGPTAYGGAQQPMAYAGGPSGQAAYSGVGYGQTGVGNQNSRMLSNPTYRPASSVPASMSGVGYANDPSRTGGIPGQASAPEPLSAGQQQGIASSYSPTDYERQRAAPYMGLPGFNIQSGYGLGFSPGGTPLQQPNSPQKQAILDKITSANQAKGYI